MNKRNISDELSEKRLLGLDEAAKYMGLGKNTTRDFASKIGAVKHFGRRVLFDKQIIDQALNEIKE